MKKTTKIAIAFSSALVCGAVFAQKTGDLLLNAGYAHVAPRASLNSISSSEPIANAALQGATVSVSNTDTLTLGASYMLTDNFAAEIAFGAPPKLKLDLNVPSGNHPNALSTTVYFPALLGNYYFGSSGDALRPFVAAGISYNKFTKNSHNSGDPTVAGLASDSISLNSTWSPVYKIGASYRVDEKWFLNGAAIFMPVNVKGSISGPGVGAGAATTDLSMKLRTNVYMVSVSYKY